MKFQIYVSTIIVLTFALACGTPKKESRENIQSDVPEVWARPGVQGQMSAGYLTYTNTLSETDTLLSATSDASMMTEVHESYMTDDGLAGMREMKQGIVVAPNEALILKPGGYHIMLMNLKSNLSEADTVNVELVFAKAGSIQMKLPVYQLNR